MLKTIFNYRSLNYSLLDQGLVSGSNFLSTVIAARVLGLNDFGVFAVLWMILLFINSIHASVIVFPMMSLVPKQTHLKRYFGSLLLGQILFVTIAFLIAITLSFVYVISLEVSTSTSTLLLFSLSVSAYHMQDFYRRYFFSIKDFSKVFVIDILTYVGRVVILTYLFFDVRYLDLESVFFIFTATFLLGAAVGAGWYRFEMDYQCFKSDTLKHWNLSKWLLPSGLMQWTSINLFLVVASFLLGPTIVGIVRLGQNIALAFNIILQGIENFIPTDASRIFLDQGLQPLIIYLTKVSFYGLVCVLFFGGVTSFFAKEILLVVYGDSYVEHSGVVFWYAVILIFMFLLVVGRVFLRTVNHTKLWFKAYLITSLYSILIVCPLLTQYGLNGVLFGTLSAHVVLIGSVSYMIRKKRFLK